MKLTFFLILLCSRHKKCAKSHKQSQFTSKFVPTSVCDIFKQSHLTDRAKLWAASFTLYKLATVFLQLVTKRQPEVFLISSPANQIIIVLSSRYISTQWLALSNNWGQDYNERHLTVFTFPLRTGLTMTRKQQKQLEFMKLLISFLSYTDWTVVREWWPHYYMIGGHSLLLGSI